MSFTCFEPEGSSLGRRLNIQFLYGTFYVQRYKQSRPTILPTGVLIPLYVKRTIP